MIKEKKILMNYLLYILLFIGICIIGISNVFADTYDGSNYTAQLYDNYGPSLTAVSTSHETSGDNYYYGYINLVANSSGGAWGISSPIPLLSNHTYTMTAEVYATGCGSVILSTYNRIGVGTTMANAKSSYENNYYVNEQYSKAVASNLLQFAFTPSINGSYIVFAYSTSSSCSNMASAIKSIAFEDLGAGGVSESTINNSLNNQTTIINNSITSSTNDIKSSIKSTEDNIIANQDANNDALIENDNANTQKIIDENKKNFETCKDKKPTYVKSLKGSLFYSNDKVYFERNDLSILVYEVEEFDTYTFKFLNYNRLRVYLSDTLYEQSQIPFNVDDYLVINNNSPTINEEYTINVNKKYIYMYLSGDSSSVGEIEFNASGQICTNKLDETKDAINNLNDNITDDSVSSSDDTLSNLQNELPTNSVISDLLLLPVRLLQALVNSLGGTCSSFNLGSLYGTNLIMPCINIQSYLGSSIWTFIDLVFSGMFVLVIRKKFIQIWENITNLRNGGNEVD